MAANVAAGFLEKIMPDVAGSLINAVTTGGPRRQYKWNKKAAALSRQWNREDQERLLQTNLRLQEEQRMYDSPASQMARYKAAGLNPHLIYGGSGGSAGGVFPIDAGNVPGTNVQAPSAHWPDVAGSFLRAGQTIAQTNLAEARAGEVAQNTALKEVLTDIAKTNPMLDPAVYNSVIQSMQVLADAKAKEAKATWSLREQTTETGDWRRYTIGEAKIEADLEAMEQRLGLNTADLSIKNKILESKEFENVVKELQAQWLKNGDITWEHTRQALMLLLSKMVGK